MPVDANKTQNQLKKDATSKNAILKRGGVQGGGIKIVFLNFIFDFSFFEAQCSRLSAHAGRLDRFPDLDSKKKSGHDRQGRSEDLQNLDSKRAVQDRKTP